MYNNHHDDDHYSDSRYSDRHERLEQQTHAPDYNRADHQYATEGRYIDERNSTATSDHYPRDGYGYDHQAISDRCDQSHHDDEQYRHLGQQQHEEEYDFAPHQTESYYPADEVILINEPIDEEFYSDQRYTEECHTEDRYTEERFAEERYNEERYNEERYSDEVYNEALYTDAYHSNTHLDPEIYEYNQDGAGVLYAEDFMDVQHGPKNRFVAALGKVGVGLAIAVFTIGFATLTMFASKPQMTPQDIVQMEGYKGSARDRTLFFNLASIRDCNDNKDCDGEAKVKPADVQSQTGSSAITTNGLKPSDRHSSNTTVYREIPAVGAPQKNSNDYTGGWKVKEQWSNVRETPEANGAIVTSLEADIRITIINSVGEWREVATDDTTKKPIGFIHHSLLQRI